MTYTIRSIPRYKLTNSNRYDERETHHAIGLIVGCHYICNPCNCKAVHMSGQSIPLFFSQCSLLKM